LTYDPQIYDWRRSCAPINQVIRAAGTSTQGGMTLGGAMVSYPQAGGRLSVHMEFAPFASVAANEDASWTISRIMNGNIMRVPIYNSVQLVPVAELNGAGLTNGIPWSNDQPWGSGENWSWSPFVPVAAVALRGAESFAVDMAAVGRVLRIGHVLGFTYGQIDAAHVVMDIEYDAADVATVSIQPSLRRALAVDDQMLFRPRVLATCANAGEVMSTFQSGRHMTFNPAVFIEALL